MGTKKISLVTVFVVLLVNSAAFADRQFENAEIKQIFQQLTSQPRRTWIPAGSIEAIHEEYKAPKTMNTEDVKRRISEKITEYQDSSNKLESTETMQKMKLDAIPFNERYKLLNEFTMSSKETVRFDGERFYWEITVHSRKDSVTPSKELADNFMTEEFNLDWNERRVFVWDGENYTVYSLPVNCAVVDSTDATPHVVNGPLTAGVIPWGLRYRRRQIQSRSKVSAKRCITFTPGPKS